MDAPATWTDNGTSNFYGAGTYTLPISLSSNWRIVICSEYSRAAVLGTVQIHNSSYNNINEMSISISKFRFGTEHSQDSFKVTTFIIGK